MDKLRSVFADQVAVLATGGGGFAVISLADIAIITQIVVGLVTIVCTIAITLYKIKSKKKNE